MMTTATREASDVAARSTVPVGDPLKVESASVGPAEVSAPRGSSVPPVIAPTQAASSAVAVPERAASAPSSVRTPAPWNRPESAGQSGPAGARSGPDAEVTMIITIDGPAGGGKSTAARNLARRLKMPFLDTGAMYRALTLKALRSEIDVADAAAVADLLPRTTIDVTGTAEGLRVLLDGTDVGGEIRTPDVTAATILVSQQRAVREWMAARQREAAASLGSVVSEGRDQGTVVFPGADVKFYIAADITARARRRQEELLRSGIMQDLDVLRDAIARRDHEDMNREVAPLRRPADAVDVDSTHLSQQEVEDRLVEVVTGRMAGRTPH